MCRKFTETESEKENKSVKILPNLAQSCWAHSPGFQKNNGFFRIKYFSSVHLESGFLAENDSFLGVFVCS